MTTTTQGLQAAREEKERQRVALMRLEYKRKTGELIDRATAEKAVFTRARLERDAWLSWVTRAAPELSVELRADERAVFIALDRLVRRNLEELARTPLNVLSDGHLD
jgi:hypothetical protein